MIVDMQLPQLIAMVVLALSPIASRPQVSTVTIPIYCSSGTYGYSAHASEDAYFLGQVVDFCLLDNTRTPLSSRPKWQIRDAKNNVIFDSSAGVSGPNLFEVYYGSWNQKNSAGAQVAPGRYTLTFPDISSEASTTFTVFRKFTPVPPPDRNVTYKSPVALSANSLSEYYFPSGGSTTFKGTINNYTYNEAKTILIDLELYNQDNARVSQKIWNNVTLQPFQSQVIDWTSPPDLNPGVYYIDVGVYTDDGTRLLSWFPRYQNFTVAP